MSRAIAKCVIIGLGTDASLYPHGRNAEEFGNLVAMGMKPLDALKAGTSVNAALLGIAAEAGTLERGEASGHHSGTRRSLYRHSPNRQGTLRDEARHRGTATIGSAVIGWDSFERRTHLSGLFAVSYICPARPRRRSEGMTDHF